MNDFNIYDYFENNEIIPFLSISKRSSDKYEKWREGISTFDMFSYKYYGNSLLGNIISLANPEYIDSNNIPDGTVIRIPFPFDDVKIELKNKIEEYKQL
jgi:hypothetical protein